MPQLGFSLILTNIYREIRKKKAVQ